MKNKIQKTKSLLFQAFNEIKDNNQFEKTRISIQTAIASLNKIQEKKEKSTSVKEKWENEAKKFATMSKEQSNKSLEQIDSMIKYEEKKLSKNELFFS